MPPLGRIDERILVLAPTGRDALLTGEILADAGFSPHTCRDVEEICRELDAGAAVALLAEEALGDPVRKRLIRVLARQEPWSDLPLVIFTVGEAVAHDALEILGNVTLLERPVRVTTLVTTVRTALGARRRQYQVRDLLRRLEEADRRKDEFLAMLGHELRNPLSAVSNALHLLGLRAGSDPSLQRMHDVLQRQTRNMTRLVDDLLDVSRITRGKIELRKEPMDLGAIVERAVRGMRPFIDARGHELSVSLPPEPITVQVDPTRLEQVITNLLHNAAKYTEPGGRISLTAGREGDDAVLRVRDTGVGIAPDLLARVFDLFTQAERSLDRSQGGLGVGLTLVRRLVEMHGGKVRASSAGPGTGSEFEVRLPLEKAAPGSRLQAPGESNSFPTWSLEPGAWSPEPGAPGSHQREAHPGGRGQCGRGPHAGRGAGDVGAHGPRRARRYHGPGGGGCLGTGGRAARHWAARDRRL
jgi:signal transduction histidine kinase